MPIRATAIVDHRKAYLDYEGPVSRDRGYVARVDGGTYRLVERTAQRWVFELDGRVLRGRFCLVRSDDDSRDEWVLSGG